ncbi:hypothetical protein EUX58_22555 [Pseudomonas sp. 770NI]|nr:hypothetical protein EUX58_22555 [Pseudomonas sp. 770NI]
MLSPRCCFYGTALPLGQRVKCSGTDAVSCVACKGLIAGKPAPTVDRVHTSRNVGAGLPATAI